MLLPLLLAALSRVWRILLLLPHSGHQLRAVQSRAESRGKTRSSSLVNWPSSPKVIHLIASYLSGLFLSFTLDGRVMLLVSYRIVGRRLTEEQSRAVSSSSCPYVMWCQHVFAFGHMWPMNGTKRLTRLVPATAGLTFSLPPSLPPTPNSSSSSALYLAQRSTLHMCYLYSLSLFLPFVLSVVHDRSQHQHEPRTHETLYYVLIPIRVSLLSLLV